MKVQLKKATKSTAKLLVKAMVKKVAKVAVSSKTITGTVKKIVSKKGKLYPAKDASYSIKLICCEKDCKQIRWVKPSDAHHTTRCQDCAATYKRAQAAVRMAKYRSKAKKAVAKPKTKQMSKSATA